MAAQSKVQPRIVRGLIAGPSRTLGDLSESARSNSYAGTNPIAIGKLPYQLHLQPAISVAAVVAQQLRFLPVVSYQHIGIAIVVVIGKCSGPTDAGARNGLAKSLADTLKLASDIPKDQLLLLIPSAFVE